GFAIPVDTVNAVVTELIRFGVIKRPYLGVRFAPPTINAQLGIQGAIVGEVIPGSPAEAAGIHPTVQAPQGGIILGDIIVSIDGKPIRNYGDVVSALFDHKVGDVLDMKVIRGIRPGGTA